MHILLPSVEVVVFTEIFTPFYPLQWCIPRVIRTTLERLNAAPPAAALCVLLYSVHRRFQSADTAWKQRYQVTCKVGENSPLPHTTGSGRVSLTHWPSHYWHRMRQFRGGDNNSGCQECPGVWGLTAPVALFVSWLAWLGEKLTQSS